jgi:hypothetical protein
MIDCRRDNVVVAVGGGGAGVVDEGSSVVIVTIFHDDMAERIMNNEASIYPNYQTRHTSNKQHHSSSMQHLLFFSLSRYCSTSFRTIMECAYCL